MTTVKYFDIALNTSLEKDEAVHAALFGLIDISGAGQLEKIEAKLEVITNLCVKNETKKVKSVNDLNKLAGFKRFTEVK